MDFTDTPELAAYRASARAWLASNLPRRTEQKGAINIFGEVADETAQLARARETQARLVDGGWAGITWPEEYGGQGLTPLHEIVFQQEASNYALDTEVFGIGIGMGGPTIMAWGTAEQKQRWLRPLLRGEEIWCQLFSEPEAGSDVAGVRTRAVRDGDEWIVNGQKVWTSGAHYSKWGMLLARTDPSVPKHAGLSYLMIDMQQPGVECRPLRQMTGGQNFNEVFFNDARVPADHLIGIEGQGWAVAVTTLMNERLSIGRVLVSSQGVFEKVLDLLGEIATTTGSDPLARDDVRSRVIDIYTRGQVLRFMTQRLVTSFAKGSIPTAEGSAAKLGLTSMAETLGNLVIEAQGPRGMLDGDDAVDGGAWALTFLSYPGLKIAGGTDEVLKNLIGERVLGLPSEPRVDKEVPFRELVG